MQDAGPCPVCDCVETHHIGRYVRCADCGFLLAYTVDGDVIYPPIDRRALNVKRGEVNLDAGP